MSGPKTAPTPGAPAREDEQPGEDRRRRRYDVRIEDGRVDVQALDRAQDRDGGRDHAVAIEQRRAEEPDAAEDRALRREPLAPREQRQERQDAALAVVVRAHDERRI
jgi:hypothetical protein